MLEKRKPERRDRTATPRPAAGGRELPFLGAIQKTGISVYSCFYNDGDIMCTINILSRRIKTESKINAVYDISINNHIRCSEDSLLAQLERVQPLKQNFESLLDKVIK